MELMITIPVLFGIFLMMMHFGQVVYTQLALRHATHVAAQIFAKTDECGTAQDYFRANFNRPDTVGIYCERSDNDRRINAEYTYQSNALAVFFVPALTLKSTSVAYLEKP